MSESTTVSTGSHGEPWQMAGVKSDVSAGDSTNDIIENTTPPLVIISSRVRSPGEQNVCLSVCHVMGVLCRCLGQLCE